MAWEQGRFDEHLDVSGERQIQGAVTAGATVRAGGILIVQGAVAGPLNIEDGGSVSVQGTLAGPVTNEGLLIVAGVITEPLGGNGDVLVAAGTLITTATPPGRLMADGTVAPVSDEGITVNIDASTEYLRLTADGRFVRAQADD